ncbi:unnamed protein product [Adineta steineri]|uniref:Uncharacterized protein n=1 Tax=Adineta steineri TaxID=433720 RepID=A0A819J9R2_9BILA|nr:unnamed protein product [Adineta steineri]
MASEDVNEYDQLNSEKEIRFAAIKEQAILLSGEINDHCRLFRDRLRSRQILGYTDLVAKLYYDIAYANYKYYHRNLVRDNLLLVKKCLEKSIQQFSEEQQITDRINIVKEAKYFLDSVCDLYLKSNIQQNNLPTIPGNAVILVKTENSHEYISYFVENGSFVDDKINLKSILISNIDLDNLKFNDKSGLVQRTTINIEHIEKITKSAQLKRSRASIDIKYKTLKRKRKNIEENLKKMVSDLHNIQEEDTQESSNMESSSSIIFELLLEIIECNLEIGCIDEVEHYINILKRVGGEYFQNKLNEFNLRKDLIIQLNKILETETALLTAQEDDVQYIIVKKPENISDYKKEMNKWKKNQNSPENSSVLFLYNPEENENRWESWFWIPQKRKEIFNLNIRENSKLSIFLKHIYYNKTAHVFSGELLDMLTDENILFINDRFILKSKRTKLIDFCSVLRNVYDSIGHDPLGEHYRRVVEYLLREKDKFLEQFSSSGNTEYHSEKNQQNQFPLSLFSLCAGSAIKKLNDRIHEKEFFSDILPYINQIKDLRRSLNFIYNIDWQFCYNQDDKEKVFQNWYKDNVEFNREHPYERKYLFLLIECDLYFILNFDEKNLPKISGNAIILTKIRDRNDYKAYFMKDSIWIKDSRISGLKNIIVKNIQKVSETGLIDNNSFKDQENRNQIEKLATEMKLNRWYFYGEVSYGRVSEGFIDQKNELKPLEIYLKNILLSDIKNNNNNKLLNKESQILNHLSEIDKEHNYETSSSSEQYFIKPMSKVTYDQQISLNKGIRIYDLRKIDHAKDLKTRIQSDRKESFSCVVKLSNKHYVTLFIEHETRYNREYYLRYIYILNSTFEKRILKRLKWFTGVSGECIYKLNFIQCPKQKLMSEDSLLHAYFNASACQWASDNQHWEFLKKNFHRQTFSSKENIEKIKQWLIENTENIFISKHIEEEAPQQETFEVIEHFKNIFLKIITLYLNSVDIKEINNCVENLGKKFVTIKTFDDIYQCISNIIEIENHNEIQECISEIEKTRDNAEEIKREYFEVDTVVDIMFSILKEYSLKLLTYQEQLSKNFEHFEDSLHHAILLNLAKKSNLISQEKYPTCATRMDAILKLSHPNFDNESHSSYIKFIESLGSHLENEKMFSNRDELLSICQNLKEILENVKTEDIPVSNQLAKKSLNVVSDFTKKFAETENTLKEFHQIFKCLLPYCYELSNISEINKKLKDNIYNYISYQEQSFDNIEECIKGLFKNAKRDDSIKIDFNIGSAEKKSKEILSLFKKYIESQDERTVHYIGVYLRETMMIRIDDYMKGLSSFRHATLVSIENFEKELHQFLLNSIRESIKSEKSNNQLATKARSYLSLQNNNYDMKICMYKNVMQVFNSSIPSEIIQSVKLQLENTSHSHSVYLQIKINDLTAMLNRFSKVEKLLPEFSKLFQKCLNNTYDHLSEQEVFSTNGKIKKDVFDCLKQNKNFNDIKKLTQNFNNTQLTHIVQQCEEFVKDKDEKASTEISQCLRQCIIDTVENYTTSLLTYRHKALTAFNHFEKNLYDLLSSYEIIGNKNLRGYLKQILDKFNKLPNDANSDYYSRSLEVYRNFVNTNNMNGEFKERASVIKEILNENKHTLRPYFKEKINNIKNILNSYINWYKIKTFRKNEYIIYEIQTTSGILSRILKRLKAKYPDCYRPNNEIRILNSNQFYIDTDLSSSGSSSSDSSSSESPSSDSSSSESSSSESSSSESSRSKYSGVNIVLVSPYQKLVKNKDKLKIITDGEDAKDVWKDNPAKNGAGTDDNRNGNKGKGGCDGKPGKSAGHVYIVVNKLPKIRVSACGGKGGRGQDGGDGARGLDGKDGEDADKEALINRLEDSWPVRGQACSFRDRRIGTDGQSGGWGGDAGSGGFHGDGGNPGLVKLVSLDDILHETSYKNFPEKPKSHNGKSGQPGEAGKHGRDGLDYVGISNWKFLTAYRPRKTDKLKGGRLRSSYRCNKFEKQGLREYSMLSFEDGENSSRFQNKYTDRKAHRRANMTQKHKHKNQESVRKIHAINRQNVFQETTKLFDQYRNPQNFISYQPWLAPCLNKFLDKMANLEGLPPSKAHTLPDIEHDAKQILILKQKFTETISIENQRLNSEKINTEQMSIGINLLGQEILGQYNAFLQQYQIVYQQLQKDIQRIDVNQLTTGLEIRSTEIANMRNTLNRIINEQRFNQRLIASQRRTDVLIDNLQEKLSKSILDRRNIKILQEESSRQEWKKFSVENNIIKDQIIEEFNREPNEEILLKINCHFLFELEKMLSQENINQISKDHISNFTNIYLYNLQQGNFTFKNLKFIEEQKQAFFQILPELKSLENTLTLDLLIEFCKGMQRECLRHYWLIWINKTLKYTENKREIKENLLNFVNKIRVADENQLKQFDTDLKSSVLLKEFPDYDFDENLYENYRSELIESIDKFNEDSDQENLFQIFQTFSNSKFFDRKQKNSGFENLLVNIEQLNIIQDFCTIFQHNLNLMNIHQNKFRNLIEQIVKIEKILIQYPRSYFHDIIFDFAINIMRKNTCLTPDKIEHIYIIEKSKDLSKLFTFQTSEVCERKTTFTVKQQIAAFKTLYDPNLVEEIFQNLSTSSDINNLLEDEELNEFFQWTVNHLNDFDNKIIENILKSVENILQKQTNNNDLQFLKIVLTYKITKSDIEKQKQEIELIDIEKEKSVKEFISIVEKCNNLFLNISKNNEIACQFYMNLMEIVHFTEFTNFQEVSDKILCNTRITCEKVLNNLSKKDQTDKIYHILCTFKNEMREEMKNLVDQFQENVKKVVKYFKDKIENIDKQQNILRSFKEKKALLDTSDKLFSDVQNLDNYIRVVIVKKLNSQISSKQLKFCIFISEVYQKIENYLYFHLKDNNSIRLLFEEEFEIFFEKHQIQSTTIKKNLSDFVNILNLYQFNFDGKINESFTKTIKNLQNIKDEKALVKLKEQVLIDLINSYPIFNNELSSIKTYIARFSSTDGKQVKIFENILAFLYGESNGKSEYIEDIYKGFYKYCQRHLVLSDLQKKENLFNSLIQLMILIIRTHQDILYINANDINHTRFQVTLLHILFEEGNLLGDINEKFIGFLSWLFETLSTYGSIENIEDVVFFSQTSEV